MPFLSLKVQTWILMPKGRKSTSSENELFYVANVNPQQWHGYFTCTKVGRSFYFCESFKCCLTFFMLKVREIGWFITGDNLSSIVIKSIITFHSKLGTRFCLFSDKFDLCRIFDLDTCVSQWIGLSWEQTHKHIQLPVRRKFTLQSTLLGQHHLSGFRASLPVLAAAKLTIPLHPHPCNKA